MSIAGAGPRRAGRRALALGLALAFLLPTPLARAQSDVSTLQVDVGAVSRRVHNSVVVVVAKTNEQHRVRGSEVPVTRVHTRVASGVAVEENLILTTASAVMGADLISVRTANDLQAEATVLGIDPVFNIAVLRVPGVRLPVVRFATDRAPQIGDWVLTVGASYRLQFTESAGTISARYPEPRLALLQLTNTVYPGNSGGAAVNTRGELIGLVQGELGAPELVRAYAGESRPSGMSFVLPGDNVQRAYEAIRREGRVKHGYLGVTTSGSSVSSDTQEGLEVPIGARVEEVIPGGPAAKLGLKRGDLIVGFEGERVEYPGQLARWVAATPPATSIGLVWVRNSLQKVGSVLLSESPDAAPVWANIAGAAAGAGPKPQGPSPERISELERQIRALNRELSQLKGQSTGTRRE
jgi:serine protease Do